MVDTIKHYSVRDAGGVRVLMCESREAAEQHLRDEIRWGGSIINWDVIETDVNDEQTFVEAPYWLERKGD